MSHFNLHTAVLNGDLENVVNCIAAGSNVNEPYWEGGGKPPVLLAASIGNISILKFLCAQNCNVNASTIHGESALHLAIKAKKNVIECLDVLLSHGCDPNKQENLQGQTPLLYFVKYFMKNNNSESTIEFLKKFVSLSDAKITDNKQNTALHLAVRSQASVDCIKILLKSGTDKQNSRGETALHEAIESDCDIKTILILIDNSDLSQINKYKETPLHVAARKRNCEIIKYLLSKCVPVSAKDLKGNTALHLIAERGYADALLILLSSKQVEINEQNNEGLTPLHVAVESGFQMVVEILLSAENCDVAAMTKQSQTALDLAQQEYRRRSQPEISNMIFYEIQKRESKSILKA